MGLLTLKSPCQRSPSSPPKRYPAPTCIAGTHELLLPIPQLPSRQLSPKKKTSLKVGKLSAAPFRRRQPPPPPRESRRHGRRRLSAAAASLASPAAGDTNPVYDPCTDTRIQRGGDGFTFGLAFAANGAFYSGTTQLSPCDRRLNQLSQLSLFRPKVDEISLLTVNTTTGFSPASAGGYMVAFAGRKYAARSPSVFVSNTSVTVSSFTLVLEFNKGRLQNLHWKKDGCGACTGKPNFICLGKQTCAIRTNICKSNNQGSMDCSIGIQLAFSGTDKHESVLNSWYEVSNLQQYSLYGLYSNVKGSLSGQFNKFF